MEQNEQFHQAKGRILTTEAERDSIGRLAEKSVHMILKDYLDPDRTHHEVKASGFVADILNENGIIEIQTRGFDRLRRKLTAFLAEYPVTVVYPISAVTTLMTVEPETGELISTRKSPKKGTFYDCFRELYRIRSFLLEANLTIRLILMEAEEYRYENGKKRGRVRYGKLDRIPVRVLEERVLTKPSDYGVFLPENLPDEFTSADLAKATHITKAAAGQTLLILTDLAVVVRIGKQGRYILYRKA